MDWYQIAALVLPNIAIILWFRTEARNDYRKSDQEIKDLRRDMIDVMRSIDKEIKDFHGRLCSLEERRK